MTLNEAAAQLATISPTPDYDARLLHEHAAGNTKVFAALVARRLAHEPVAYITGTRGFWTIDLDVSPAVLIPRADSETLIEAAVAHFGEGGPRRVLDLGTGSGALLLAALDQWPGATGIGVDASEDALQVACANAARIAPCRAVMQSGDWTAGLDDTFDLILANPPYVENGTVLEPQVADYEPAVALYAGEDGLDAYRRLIPQLPCVLAPGGIVCLEIGSTQGDAVAALAVAAGFATKRARDLAGHERCLVLSHVAPNIVLVDGSDSG